MIDAIGVGVKPTWTVPHRTLFQECDTAANLYCAWKRFSFRCSVARLIPRIWAA
ncbi:hypothetical protein PDO_0705 [Rhizobium sp. PDO1-076]|nr:hypothetical protein PDO_0705 [Rhizobium sp. PDO1-076]